MELALYLASLGFRGIWFGSVKDQIEQPKIYMKFIIEHSYLKYLIKPNDLLKESVYFENGGYLKLKNLTEPNARSSRADFIVYDEEAQAEGDAYNAGVNILAGSDLGLIIHISTPAKATVFEENYDRLKLRELRTGEQFVFSRRWDEIERFRNRREWYEEERKRLPLWYFQQEHCAEFVLPLGAVFQNVIYDPYPDWLLKDIKDQPLCSGIDWNPVSGHWLVSGKWTQDYMGFVIQEEHDIGMGYAVDMNVDQFYIIARHMSHDNRLVIESGGINEEYIKWFYKMLSETGWNAPSQNWCEEEWDSAGLNKLRAVSYIIQNGITIYIDKHRYPNLSKMIEDCQWDPDSSEPKIKKDPASSPHALDACLHAISEKNRDISTMIIGRMF